VTVGDGAVVAAKTGVDRGRGTLRHRGRQSRDVIGHRFTEEQRRQLVDALDDDGFRPVRPSEGFESAGPTASLAVGQRRTVKYRLDAWRTMVR